ncbi:helical bundle domain-containing protein [Legionella waltersii]|uniref:Uncharacterized protein n=1 Tax=Legionella waltersii TaxID=66969 RepID=A0A0W1A2B3_9GAMM|nr:helical bundle domain-containing protein [Legionella waltersii]KTD75505.1 hypothetical protein Lwal_2443 [Legionella waltersii]SNU98380.1 Uncharacterised protein [Legionella waltersii]
MLNSSKEYLQALRDGKFVLFLQWPKFVIQKYYKDKRDTDPYADADDTLSLLIYEWLNNGFCMDDVKQFAILYAVYELESTPIAGNLLYSLASVYGALTPCMVYSSQNLQKEYLRSEVLNASQISTLMKKNLSLMDNDAYQKFSAEEVEKFRKLTEEVKASDLKKAHLEISAIARVRSVIDRYLTALQSSSDSLDKLKSTRYSLVVRLAIYFQEQTEITSEVTAQIEEYVKQIRLSQPSDDEEQFLEQLAPLSFTESAARFFTLFSINFFKLVKPQLLSIDASTDKDKPTNGTDARPKAD